MLSRVVTLLSISAASVKLNGRPLLDAPLLPNSDGGLLVLLLLLLLAILSAPESRRVSLKRVILRRGAPFEASTCCCPAELASLLLPVWTDE